MRQGGAVTRTPACEAQEEAELVLRAGQGDAQAAEALLSAHRPQLLSLARRLARGGLPSRDEPPSHGGLPSCGALTAEELAQAGCIGVLRAARRYDPAQAARFWTYAMPWVLGEMRRALRRALDATGAYDRRRQIAREEEALRSRLGRSPSFAELARACRVPDWELVQAVACAAPQTLDGDGQSALEEHIPGEEIDLAAVDLRLALARLGEEERRLILLRYFRDQTQQETARLLGKSQAQVCRMERRALDTLRQWLD